MSRLIAILLVAAAFIATAIFYDRLPNPVPVHFNEYGKADGFMMKPWGAFLTPLIMLGAAVTLAFARRRVQDERGESAARTFDIFALATLCFLLELTGVVLLVSSGFSVSLPHALFAGVGLLFVVFGNWFGKLAPNAVVGVRTRPTMTNDETWLMTHRFGGRVLFVGGIVLLVAAIRGASPPVLIGLVLAIALLPVIHSYVYKPR